MSGRLVTRATLADLQIRSVGRVVCGYAMPFNETTKVVEHGRVVTEVFVRGAFSRTLRERGDKVKVLVNHDRKAVPIGRAALLREEDRGLYVELKVSRTNAGDEALELVRDGALDGLSIGFSPERDFWSADRKRVERREVQLREISLVGFPAFDGARVTAVRRAEGIRSLSTEVARLRLDLLLKAWPR